MLTCDDHKFVTRKDMVGIMAADLERLPKPRAKGTRYLTLTHVSNLCKPEKFMEGFRQGAIKLINSLSRRPDVVVLETIDPDRSILRINIDDLGWDPADWETLVANYPYGTRPDTPLNSLLEQANGHQDHLHSCGLVRLRGIASGSRTVREAPQAAEDLAGTRQGERCRHRRQHQELQGEACRLGQVRRQRAQPPDRAASLEVRLLLDLL